MRNPIMDKGLSLESIGMLYLLTITIKDHGLDNPITRKDIERSMNLKTGLDQKHDIQLRNLAKAGYIMMETKDGNIFITLL